MRVAVGRAIRVGPGDQVVVRGQLAAAKLGRLYVFACERGNDHFSPYVPDMSSLVGSEPKLLSTMALRLTEDRPEREISFVSDIDGFVRIMQEVDTAKDPRAKVKLTRTICPDLPWPERMLRLITGILTWPTLKLS
ncbi:hypothetical protein [Bradyrhizobium lablabi]|nr:hypothetical protein [Bradyrhizobium lablabi]